MFFRTMTILAAMAASAGAALAEPIGWSYSTTPSTGLTHPGNFNTHPFLEGFGGGGVDGALDFTLNPAAVALLCSQHVRLAGLSPWVSLPTKYSDPSFYPSDRVAFFDPHGTGSGEAYSIGVTIVDAKSGQAGVVYVAGLMSGYYTPGGSYLANAFTSPATQTLTLGGTEYTIGLATFTQPGAAYLRGSGLPLPPEVGCIDVTVTPTVSAQVATPEPGTLALAGIGAGVAFGLRFLRRRFTAFVSAQRI